MATTIFQDTFTEAADTALTSHTPDVGTGWSLVWQTASTSKITVIASTDRARTDATVANSGVIYSADATYGTADYEASMVVAAGFGGTNKVYLIVRMQDQENMYALRIGTGASNTRMYKKVAGTWTAIGAFQADPAIGDTVKIQVSGSTLKFWYNATLKDTQTDSDITAAGKAGIAMGGGAELAASTDDLLNTGAVDDFLVQDLVSGPIAPTSLTAVQSGAQVNTAWTDNSSDETGFVLERKRGGSPNYYVIATPAANATSYADTAVDPGYTYTYRIKAVNGGGSSTYATSSSVTMTGTKKWTSHVEGWVFPGQADAQTELMDGRMLYAVKPEYGTLNSLGVYSEPTGYVNGIDDATMTTRSLAYSLHPYFTISANRTGMSACVADSTLRTNCINAVVSTLGSTGFTGVELDWEGYGTWTSTDWTNYKSFVVDLCTAVHAIGKKVKVCGPPIGDATEQGYYANGWHYEDLESSPVDFICVLAYDWDFDFGAGTAIAPTARVQNVCRWVRGKISNLNRIVMGGPNYGYYGTTAGFSITNITEEQAKLRTGYPGTRDTGSEEMMYASGGVSTVYNDQTGINTKREIIEDEGMLFTSWWHLGDNPWFSGKAEMDTIGATYVLNLSDGVTASDTTAKATGKAVSDAVTSNDATTKSTTKRPADTASVADAAAKAITKRLADTVSATDSSTRQSGFQRTFADTVTPTDAASKATTKRPADSVTVSDNATRQSGKGVTVNDSVTVTDAVAKTIVKIHTDNSTAADAAAKAVGKGVLDVVDGVDGRVNLIPNPSMELGNGVFWASSNLIDSGTPQYRSTVQKMFGTYSILCRFVAATNSQFYLNGASFTPVLGQTYTFSVYVYVEASTPAVTAIQIGIRDMTTFNYVGAGGTRSITPGVWTRLSYTATCTKVGEQWRVTVADPTPRTAVTGPDITWYCDGALLEVGTTPTAYFDGSMPGAFWTGTANNSVSSMPAVSKAIGKSTADQAYPLDMNVDIGNKSFDIVPPSNTAATNVSGRGIDGTASGSTNSTPYMWAIPPGSATAAEAQFDTTVSRSGGASMRLTNLTTGGVITVGGYRVTPSSTALGEIFALLPNTTYRLVGYIQTVAVPTNGAFMDLRQFAADGSAIVTNSTNKLTGTIGTWTQVALTVTTAANARYGTIFLRNNVAGAISTAWFDDVDLINDGAIAKAVGKLIVDTAVVLDAQARSFGKSFADSAAGQDAVSKQVTKRPADSVSTADQIGKAIVKRPADTVTAVDAVGKSVTKRPVDSVTTSDTFNRQVGYQRTFADGVSTADAISKRFGKVLADAITGNDAVAKMVQLVKQDAVVITDGVIVNLIVPGDKIGGVTKSLRQRENITSLRQKGVVVSLRQRNGTAILRFRKG